MARKKSTATPLQKLISRYETQHKNLTAKRRVVVEQCKEVCAEIDAKLAEADEILKRLSKK